MLVTGSTADQGSIRKDPLFVREGTTQQTWPDGLMYLGYSV
jgi:hypothetical protein